MKGREDIVFPFSIKMKEMIILFTRVPKEGTTKTRLYDFITPKQAVEVQKKLLIKNYNTLKNSGRKIKIYHDGNKNDDNDMEDLLSIKDFYYQNGETLGDKMYNAISNELVNADKVLLMGSDIFNLNNNMIELALKKLNEYDVVINPSEDGGYFLIGMKKLIKEVFALPSYGDASVLENLIRVCNKNKISYFLGETALDIDTKEDLLSAETGFKDIVLLGAGEYNINFTFTDNNKDKKVLRINMKSQMNLENQIEYEYETLKLLEKSKVTPKVYDLVTKTKLLPYKYLTMEFLNGRVLDYDKDMNIAAYLLSSIHNTAFGENNLIHATNPFQLMYDECSAMAGEYLNWEYADSVVSSYIHLFLDKCKKLLPEDYIIDKPCIINTELNSGNFLIGDTKENSYVIDWEKALIGECEQDLAHFLAPTTTFWKTDKILTKNEIDLFLSEYNKYRSYNEERFERYLIFNCLRGVTWCSMAFRQYSEKDKMLMDEFTFKKISAYVSIEFLEKISRYFS
ncbi:TIGR04282 family arsenosugar biosynthesis glycosyltransferase [Gemella bergeri]